MPKEDKIECFFIIGVWLLVVSMFIYPIVRSVFAAIIAAILAIAIFFNVILPFVKKIKNRT
jgi:hypothetical protein